MSELTNQQEAKKAFRRQMLAKRAGLGAEEAANKSRPITEKLVNSRAYQEASCIYAYLDIRNEYQTWALIEAAWQDGKRVAVPKVEGRELVFYYIETAQDLEAGFKGILEPKHTCQKAQEERALLILPGVAYDKQLNRMGYGGGFYDRFLSVHRKHPMVAPAYDFQVVDELPVESFDQKVPWIVTETREFGQMEVEIE